MLHLIFDFFQLLPCHIDAYSKDWALFVIMHCKRDKFWLIYYAGKD